MWRLLAWRFDGVDQGLARGSCDGGVGDFNSSKEALGEEVMRDAFLLCIEHLDLLANCVVRDAALRQPCGRGGMGRYPFYILVADLHTPRCVFRASNHEIGHV